MKKILLPILFFIFQVTSAQTLKLYQSNVKTYSDFYAWSPFSLATFGQKSDHMNIPTIAYHQQGKKKYFEVGVGANTLKQVYVDSASLPINTNYQFLATVRLETGKEIMSKGKHHLSAGAIFNPYILYNTSTPEVTTAFPIKNSKLAFRPELTLHYQYAITKRILAEINTILPVFSLGRTTTEIGNPSIPVNQQKYSVLDFSIPSSPSGGGFARIGIGYLLTKKVRSAQK
jgi:hypothetical protein